jgi:nitrogen-specific signal transduction histidine kinase
VTLEDLAHEIRNGVAGAKGALTLCNKGDCPLGLGRVEVIQEIKHHLNRIDRAMRVYVSNQRFGNARDSSDTDTDMG